MTEQEFWKCTPRKLNAMLKIYAELKEAEYGSGADNSKPNPAYIDQIF
jgi:hypothetical protein